MTTLCRIVLTVVTCTVDPAMPTLTPTEAVAILAAGGRQFYVAEMVPPWERYGGDDQYTRDDREWPMTGSFAPTLAPEARRLDGTSLFDPPTIYGAVPWFSRRSYGGYSYRERIHGFSDRVDQRAQSRPERRGVSGARTHRGDGQPRAGARRGAAGGHGPADPAPATRGGQPASSRAGVTSAPATRRP